MDNRQRKPFLIQTRQQTVTSHSMRHPRKNLHKIPTTTNGPAIPHAQTPSTNDITQQNDNSNRLADRTRDMLQRIDNLVISIPTPNDIDSDAAEEQ